MVYRHHGGICEKSDVITGWIGDLFPYGARFGNLSHRRKLDGTDDTDIIDFPAGLGSISFKSQRNSRVQIHAGFLGVDQLEDLTLRPKLGWAVGRQSSFDQLLEEIAVHPRCRWTVADAGKKARMLSRPITLRDLLGDEILEVIESRQLQRFYTWFRELTVISEDGNELLKIYPSDQIYWKKDCERRSALATIGKLADGRILGLEAVSINSINYPAFFLADETDAFNWKPCLLIANNFEQVLKWALESADRPLDQAPSFCPIGNVEPTQEAISQVIVPLGKLD
jgi:hypothetical protein